VKIGIVNIYTGELGNPEVPAKITQQPLAPQPATTSAPPRSDVPEKSIAVLPFENLSADPENAFFVDGVHDEILTDLARIADLKVISRTSVMQYKTAAKRNLRAIRK
jgi:TolB-like protein